MFLHELYAASGTLLPDSGSVLHVILLALLAGLTLSPLEHLVPAQPQKIFRRKGISLDLCYWFITPLLTRLVTGLVLGTFLFVLASILGLRDLSIEKLLAGFGPVAEQPWWLQAVEILIISDFVDYWTHRTLHLSRFWRIHAIHHTPEEMSWLSSSRVHPLNDLITRGFQIAPVIALGFSASAILTVLPLVSFYVMFVHSNIRWDYGPFRWLLVSPAYHRWHHTSDEEALDKNFAGIFPIWDLLFGTAYFPKRLPERYGLYKKHLEDSLWSHLIFPFK